MPQWLLPAVAASRRSFPTTLIAFDNHRLLGSASLVEEDLPETELLEGVSLSPWLANVFVVPEARGRGVGRVLVEEAAKQADDLGIEILYLFTAGKSDSIADWVDRCGNLFCITAKRRPSCIARSCIRI